MKNYIKITGLEMSAITKDVDLWFIQIYTDKGLITTRENPNRQDVKELYKALLLNLTIEHV